MTINISGLPDVLNMVSDMQQEIDYLNAFAEDVLLCLLMPETIRYQLQRELYDEDSIVEQAKDQLRKHLHAYRKILDFLKQNHIDVSQILGESEVKTVS